MFHPCFIRAKPKNPSLTPISKPSVISVPSVVFPSAQASASISGFPSPLPTNNERVLLFGSFSASQNRNVHPTFTAASVRRSSNRSSTTWNPLLNTRNTSLPGFTVHLNRLFKPSSSLTLSYYTSVFHATFGVGVTRTPANPTIVSTSPDGRSIPFHSAPVSNRRYFDGRHTSSASTSVRVPS